MARPSSASTPGSSKRKREGGSEGGKTKKSQKAKGKKTGEESRSGGPPGDVRKMDSPAVQRAKRDIKIRRLTAEQITALERAFDAADGKLSHPQKVEIAKGIGLEARQVAIWFQNRRAKWRTEQVESQYDMLKAQNQRLQDENDRLKREVDDMRIALAAARSGIAHPTPSRMEPVGGPAGGAFFGAKDAESPGSVYVKLQNLLKSMKGKHGFLPSMLPGGLGSRPLTGANSGSSGSGSDSSEESSEEERRPIKRAKRSALQKRSTHTVATPRAAAPTKDGTPGPTPTKKDSSAASKGSPADKAAVPPRAAPKPRLQREPSMGRPSTLQRRGSKLEALQLPVKMSPTMPLCADKDRLKPLGDAPTPRLGRTKPGVATPGSTPAMWLGPRSDPSPTTGPLAPGEQPPTDAAGSSGANSAAELLDKVPPSALGRGFSHLLAGPPESSPTESAISPSAYLLSDTIDASPTSGGEGAPSKATPAKPSPLGEDASAKEARLPLGSPDSDWGDALLKVDQQRSLAHAPATALPPPEVARDLMPGSRASDRMRSRSPSVPPPVPDFPNSAAQDFLAKYRAVYGEIHRNSDPPPGDANSKGTDSLLAFVNGVDGEDEDGRKGTPPSWRSADDVMEAAGLAQRLAALDGGSKGLTGLAGLHLGGAAGAGDDKAALELSLDLGSGLAHAHAHTAQLLGDTTAREEGATNVPSRLARGTSFLGSASAFEAFRGGGNLLDPYQDPPFSSGLRDERALSPSLREAINQHQSGHAASHTFLQLDSRDDAGAAGPLTPRLGGQIQQGVPPWLSAVANGLWGDNSSPAVQTSSPGWWTRFQTGQ